MTPLSSKSTTEHRLLPMPKSVLRVPGSKLRPRRRVVWHQEEVRQTTEIQNYRDLGDQLWYTAEDLQQMKDESTGLKMEKPAVPKRIMRRKQHFDAEAKADETLLEKIHQLKKSLENEKSSKRSAGRIGICST
jgi:deoxyadenosine/deoxycytidine kinase